MAKQTLDLFKLFRLVVEKGGLVEVSCYECSLCIIGFSSLPISQLTTH